MSFTPGPQRESRRSLDDVATLKALANPVRRRLLNHLMTFGEQTASQCAEVVGETPSNCSYHLRELDRFGLVERAPGEGDGRERLWRSDVTGLRMDLAADPVDPAVRTAELALVHGDLALADELTEAALAGWAAEPGDWRAAATLSTYALRMTPEELAGLVERIDILIRPFISLTREPTDRAEIVHLRLDAFRHPAARS